MVDTPARSFWRNAIFVMFAASYDWTQIIRHMPPHKQWELWKGIPWPKHLSDDEWPLPDDYKDEKSNPIRYVLWGKYALSLLPGKRFRIGRLRDPNRHRDAKGQWDFASKPITIYDSFGFFQMKFTEAVSGYGEGVLTPAEFTRLELGKNRRPAMGEIPFTEIVDYTSIELGALARIMEINRHAIKGLGLELNAWYGAGVIANAMMMKYRVRAYYPDIVQKELPEPQRWAHQAFFGGRIELVKQGTHEPRFFNYDISSAYPHILRHLPNMAGNEWRHWDAEQLLTAGYSDDQPISGRWRRTSNEIDQILAAIDGLSVVSMVRVKFSFCGQRRYIGQLESGEVRFSFAPVPWYPLPIRDVDGSIYFPSYGHGIYCVEEIRAALRWAKRIYEHARADEKPQIALAEAWQFIPINDAKPFGFIEEIFKRRARIDAQNKEAKAAWLRNGMHGPEPYDATEKILKLGMNSVYGKTAQAVGSDVPKTANPFFAAAVTAGTRAMMVDASSADPDAVIAFATDGIFSVRELPLKPAEEKLLGEWELKQRCDGLFVQSGVYTFEDFHADALPTDEVPKRTSKTRGIRPAGLPTGKTAAQFLIEVVPEAWRRANPPFILNIAPTRRLARRLPRAPPARWRVTGSPASANAPSKVRARSARARAPAKGTRGHATGV